MNDLSNVETAIALAGGKKIHWGRWLFAFLGLLVFLAGIFLLRSEFSVYGEGTVMAGEEWEIQSPSDAWVIKAEVAEGEEVREGQLLWQLDDEDLRQQLIELREEREELKLRKQAAQIALSGIGQAPDYLELDTAGENLAMMERMIAERKDLLERYAELAERQAISTLQIRQEELALMRDQMEKREWRYLHELVEGAFFDRERNRYEVEIAGLRQKKELLEQKEELLQRQIDARSIRSPANGFLTNVQVRKPRQAVQRGQVFAHLINPHSEKLVRAYVGERNIDLVGPGTPVRMDSRVFDSPLEGYVYGSVQRVGREFHRAESSARGERVYEVDIVVEESPFDLVYGSSLEVEIILGSRSLWQVMIGHREETRNSQ